MWPNEFHNGFFEYRCDDASLFHPFEFLTFFSLLPTLILIIDGALLFYSRYQKHGSIYVRNAAGTTNLLVIISQIFMMSFLTLFSLLCMKRETEETEVVSHNHNIHTDAYCTTTFVVMMLSISFQVAGTLNLSIMFWEVNETNMTKYRNFFFLLVLIFLCFSALVVAFPISEDGGPTTHFYSYVNAPLLNLTTAFLCCFGFRKLSKLYIPLIRQRELSLWRQTLTEQMGMWDNTTTTTNNNTSGSNSALITTSSHSDTNTNTTSNPPRHISSPSIASTMEMDPAQPIDPFVDAETVDLDTSPNWSTFADWRMDNITASVNPEGGVPSSHTTTIDTSFFKFTSVGEMMNTIFPPLWGVRDQPTNNNWIDAFTMMKRTVASIVFWCLITSFLFLFEVSERRERALMKTSILAMNQHPRNGYRHDGYIHN